MGVGERMSDKKGRIVRYAVLILAMSVGLLTGCGQHVMQSEQVNSGQSIDIGHEGQADGGEETGLAIAVSPQEKRISWIIYSEGCYTYLSDGFYGYLAEDGSEITPCIYSEAAPFSEGLACVCLDGKYGYIGKDGETALPLSMTRPPPLWRGQPILPVGRNTG